MRLKSLEKKNIIKADCRQQPFHHHGKSIFYEEAKTSNERTTEKEKNTE